MKNTSNKRSRPHYLYVILSVTSVLFLLGSFSLFLFKAQRLIDGMKENINIIVELKNSSSSEDLQHLRRSIIERRFVKAGSLSFVTKEEGLKSLEEDFGDDIARLGLPNPLSDLFTFNVRAAYMQNDSLRQIRNELKNFAIVQDVFYQQNILKNAAQNLERISYFALICGLLLFIIAVFLIHNTVRLSLLDNRFLIKNMQLVGASWSFISWPYIWKAIRNGVISAILAISVILAVTIWVDDNIPGLDLLNNLTDLAILFAIILILGIVINTTSTYFAVNKYLRMRVDDLY